MTLRDTEAPTQPGGHWGSSRVVCVRPGALSDSVVSYNQTTNRGVPRVPGSRRAPRKSAHPIRRCLGLGGGSGGCGRSLGIGRVHRQTCWLINWAAPLQRSRRGAVQGLWCWTCQLPRRRWNHLVQFVCSARAFSKIYPLAWQLQTSGLSFTWRISIRRHRSPRSAPSLQLLSPKPEAQPWLSWWNTWWEDSWRTWQADWRRRNPKERNQTPPRRGWLKRNSNNTSNS